MILKNSLTMNLRTWNLVRRIWYSLFNWNKHFATPKILHVNCTSFVTLTGSVCNSLKYWTTPLEPFATLLVQVPLCSAPTRRRADLLICHHFGLHRTLSSCSLGKHPERSANTWRNRLLHRRCSRSCKHSRANALSAQGGMWRANKGLGRAAAAAAHCWESDIIGLGLDQCSMCRPVRKAH